MNATRPVYMSAAGLERTRTLLTRRCAEYDEICRERSVAHELSGDGWHDNPHFNRLQQLEADKSREIAQTRALLAMARVVEIDACRRPVDAVRLGSLVQVEIRHVATGEVQVVRYEVVGYDESDGPAGRIAYNSPLASRLIGLEPGECVTVTLAGGVVEVTIDALLASGQAVEAEACHASAATAGSGNPDR